MPDMPDRLLVEWLQDGPDRGPQHGLERALAATRRTAQRPRWSLSGTWVGAGAELDQDDRPGVRRSPVLRFALVGAIALVVGAVGLGSIVRNGNVDGPGGPGLPAPSASPSLSALPSPSAPATPSPGDGSAPPGWPTPAPLVPATPLPDPAGEPIPDSMVGRTYDSSPLEVQGMQALVLTLRAADDPHCTAMFGGRSTCFTILWTPNYPLHASDPAVRGPARIVDGNLVLGFALVPNDPGCEGTTSTYAILADGSTLRGTDVPTCSFLGFTRH